MAYDEYGDWYDEEEDPYKYADYTMEDGTKHSYDPATGTEYNDTGYVPWEQTPLGQLEASGTPSGSIFGPDGQPVDGWSRTADGYTYSGVNELPPPNPNPNPTPTPTSTSGGGDSGGGGWSSPGSTTAPSLLAPYPRTFQRPDPAMISQAVRDALAQLPGRPEYTAPEIPTIEPWRQPSEQDMYADPSFGFRKGIGEQALLNNRAAQGLSRSGGTLKDLLAYNQNFASQEYGNIANRSLEGWRSNTDATLRRSGLEQERSRSMYEPQFAEYQNKVAVATRVPELEYDRSWREFLADYDIWNDQRGFTRDSLQGLADFGLDAATR